jgi:alkanesulfonate monooxygenase SsuD/methylene tetrahydromethanopterin reductase-like flavin-dependent oxidoreductase (luciferase family)
MKFGLGLAVQHHPDDDQAARFREHLEQVRLARAVGFSTVWASQHFLAQPFTYFQPIPTLGRIAAEAEGMTLGTGIILLPLFQPLDIAEQIATLDVITGGRMILGVGLGYRDDENAAFGVDPKTRVGRLTEGVEVIERLWMGEPVTYEGRHFTLRDVQISLRPVQRPRPRIWLAANTDAGVRRAARLGDAWLINPHSTLPSIERQLALFHETRRQLGKPRATDIPLLKECVVAEDAKTALADARPYLEAKYKAYQKWNQDDALPPGETFDLAFEDLARDRFIVGDPARAVDEIERYREKLGITELSFRVQWPGMPQAAILRSIRLLGEKVLPKLR